MVPVERAVENAEFCIWPFCHKDKPFRDNQQYVICPEGALLICPNRPARLGNAFWPGCYCFNADVTVVPVTLRAIETANCIWPFCKHTPTTEAPAPTPFPDYNPYDPSAGDDWDQVGSTHTFHDGDQASVPWEDEPGPWDTETDWTTRYWRTIDGKTVYTTPYVARAVETAEFRCIWPFCPKSTSTEEEEPYVPTPYITLTVPVSEDNWRLTTITGSKRDVPLTRASDVTAVGSPSEPTPAIPTNTQFSNAPNAAET